MAKPVGAVDETDFGYLVDFTGSNYLYAYFSYPIPIAPTHWANAPMMKRHKIKLREHVTVAAGDTLYLEWYLLGGDAPDTLLLANDYAGAIAGAQQAASTADVYTEGSVFSPYNAAPEDNTLPRFVCGYCRMQSENGGNNYLNSVYIEIINDEAYADPDPSGGRMVTLIDRDNAGNRIYAPNEFLSAYEIQRVAVHSMNRSTYENRWGFTLQMFGAYAP